MQGAPLRIKPKCLNAWWLDVLTDSAVCSRSPEHTALRYSWVPPSTRSNMIQLLSTYQQLGPWCPPGHIQVWAWECGGKSDDLWNESLLGTRVQHSPMMEGKILWCGNLWNSWNKCMVGLVLCRIINWFALIFKAIHCTMGITALEMCFMSQIQGRWFVSLVSPKKPHK